MEDNLRWKMTFDGRRPSMEDDLCVLVIFSLPELLTIQSCYVMSSNVVLHITGITSKIDHP